MVASGRLAALVFGVVLTVAGCDAVQGAADGVGDAADTVNAAVGTIDVCQDALGMVAAPPDLTEPEEALDQAHRTAGELQGLAATVEDADIRGAITDLADVMSSATLDNLVADPATWVRARADQVAALTTACTP